MYIYISYSWLSRVRKYYTFYPLYFVISYVYFIFYLFISLLPLFISCIYYILFIFLLCLFLHVSYIKYFQRIDRKNPLPSFIFSNLENCDLYTVVFVCPRIITRSLRKFRNPSQKERDEEKG